MLGGLRLAGQTSPIHQEMFRRSLPDTVTTAIPVVSLPDAIAITPDGAKVYVTYLNKVATIDTATGQLVGSPIQVDQGDDAWGVAVRPLTDSMPLVSNRSPKGG